MDFLAKAGLGVICLLTLFAHGHMAQAAKGSSVQCSITG